MKKILFVLPWLPFPPKSGGHRALLSSISVLKDDFDIFLAYYAMDNEEYHKNEKEFLELMPKAHLYPFFINNQISPDYPVWYTIISRIKNLITNLIRKRKINIENNAYDNNLCTSWINDYFSLGKDWLEHVTKLCYEQNFDIIQVEMSFLISQVLTLPEKSKKVFVHHELGFVRRDLEILQFHTSDYMKACKAYADVVEIGLLNKYDAVLTVSSIDKQKLLANHVNVPVYDSFLIVNTPKEISFENKIEKHLSFIGPDSHYPNYDGIKWFLENCWLKLLKQDADYRLTIIGEWSQDHISEYTLKYPNMDFLGYVDDLAASLRNTIMIVPINIGSGIRMKILEACSLGVPFVSTTVGAEGIPVVDGESCYIADTSELFIEKIIKLQDADIQKKFINNAHQMVVRNFSSEALRENRLNIYKKILE